MPIEELDIDKTDFGILQLLQENSRGATTVDMADQLSVSDQTIRNRIEKLEDRGVIEGYYTKVNYEKVGFQIRIRFTCTAPVQERQTLAAKTLQLDNIVRVEETLGAKENVRPLAVTNSAEEITTIASELDDLGLVLESQHLVNNERVRPFNQFGESGFSSP